MTAWPPTSMILLAIEAVRFAVHRFRGRLVRRVDETEDALGRRGRTSSSGSSRRASPARRRPSRACLRALRASRHAVVAIHVGRHGTFRPRGDTATLASRSSKHFDKYRADELPQLGVTGAGSRRLPDYDLAASRPIQPAEPVVAYDWRGSVISPASTWCTSSAISAPTRSRWRGSAVGSPAWTSRPSALCGGPGLAGAGGATFGIVESELYAVPAVLGRRFRPRIYRCRRAQLAARYRGVGAGGRRPAAPGRPALRARRAPDAVHPLRRRQRRRRVRVTLPYFEGNAQHWVSDVTYTDGPPVSSPEQYEWNHGSARPCRP